MSNNTEELQSSNILINPTQQQQQQQQHLINPQQQQQPSNIIISPPQQQQPQAFYPTASTSTAMPPPPPPQYYQQMMQQQVDYSQQQIPTQQLLAQMQQQQQLPLVNQQQMIDVIKSNHEPEEVPEKLNDYTIVNIPEDVQNAFLNKTNKNLSMSQVFMKENNIEYPSMQKDFEFLKKLKLNPQFIEKIYISLIKISTEQYPIVSLTHLILNQYFVLIKDYNNETERELDVLYPTLCTYLYFVIAYAITLGRMKIFNVCSSRSNMNLSSISVIKASKRVNPMLLELNGGDGTERVAEIEELEVKDEAAALENQFKKKLESVFRVKETLKNLGAEHLMDAFEIGKIIAMAPPIDFSPLHIQSLQFNNSFTYNDTKKHIPVKALNISFSSPHLLFCEQIQGTYFYLTPKSLDTLTKVMINCFDNSISFKGNDRIRIRKKMTIHTLGKCNDEVEEVPSLFKTTYKTMMTPVQELYAIYQNGKNMCFYNMYCDLGFFVPDFDKIAFDKIIYDVKEKQISIKKLMSVYKECRPEKNIEIEVSYNNTHLIDLYNVVYGEESLQIKNKESNENYIKRKNELDKLLNDQKITTKRKSKKHNDDDYDEDDNEEEEEEEEEEGTRKKKSKK